MNELKTLPLLSQTTPNSALDSALAKERYFNKKFVFFLRLLQLSSLVNETGGIRDKDSSAVFSDQSLTASFCC